MNNDRVWPNHPEFRGIRCQMSAKESDPRAPGFERAP